MPRRACYAFRMLRLVAALAIVLGSGSAFADEPKPEGGTECRAIDADGKTVIAKASNVSSVKCGTDLMKAVQAAKCTADMKGKRIEYTVQSDHMVGKTKVKDRKTSLTCTAATRK